MLLIASLVIARCLPSVRVFLASNHFWHTSWQTTFPLSGGSGVKAGGERKVAAPQQFPLLRSNTGLLRVQNTRYNCCMSTLTYKYRIKDQTSRTHLLQMSYAINRVW